MTLGDQSNSSEQTPFFFRWPNPISLEDLRANVNGFSPVQRPSAKVAGKNAKEIKEAINELASLARREHQVCEDNYYSCPKAEGGCGDRRMGNQCTCGADAHNAKVDAILNRLQQCSVGVELTDDDFRRLMSINGFVLVSSKSEYNSGYECTGRSAFSAFRSAIDLALGRIGISPSAWSRDSFSSGDEFRTWSELSRDEFSRVSARFRDPVITGREAAIRFGDEYIAELGS
jgi:hypothetical protein